MQPRVRGGALYSVDCLRQQLFLVLCELNFSTNFSFCQNYFSKQPNEFHATQNRRSDRLMRRPSPHSQDLHIMH